jgi:putative DNA primase/helicase
MSPEELLRQNDITLKSYAPGRHYTTCPKCSHLRKAVHRKLECLGVNVRTDGADFGCNHCGWTGPKKGGGKPNGADNLPFHIYRDRDGVIRFRKMRNAPGRIPKCWFEKWDGVGWLKGKDVMKGVDTTILYRADEIGQAIEDGREIACAEGEKDCDRLWSLGIPATCNSTGAAKPGERAKWTKRHSEQLAGADIVVLNDHDDPGRAHAEATCQCSVGVAKRVRRLDLADHWRDIGKGDDVSDWIDGGGGTREKLQKLIGEAPDYQPQPSQPDPAAGVSFLITKAQKEELRNRGFTEDQIREMTPAEAHKRLGHGLAGSSSSSSSSSSPPPPSSSPANLTEQAVMRLFVDENKDRLRYNHDTKTWLIWRGHRWREDGRHKHFAMIKALCRSLGRGYAIQKIKFARAVEEGARSEPEFSAVSADWDADPMLLGTPGGVVDLRTGALRPGKPEDMISKIVAVTPSERAECPRWLKFLDQALNRKADNIAFLKRFSGYGLTGSTKEEMLLFVAGKPGSGKGTATKTIASIMRDYALTVPVTMFTDSAWRALEYYRARLVGRRLILASEPEKGATWSDAFVNGLTGSDRIPARNPAGKPFDFDPTHKLAFNAEQVPELKSVSTGLRRRLGLLPFDHPPPPAEVDVNLKEALKAEWPGILRWMIDGALDWQKIALAPPPDVRAAVEEYFTNQDIIGRWIEECCDTVSTYAARPSKLLVSFNAWADRNNERRMNNNSFHQAMKVRFRIKKLDGNTYVEGIGFKPKPDLDVPGREF